MKKPRVVITGGTGLLAVNWACAVREKWDVILGTHQHSINLKGVTSCRLNLEDPKQLELQLNQLAPDLLVHAAGLTNVNCCEEFPKLAQHANAEIVRSVGGLDDYLEGLTLQEDEGRCLELFHTVS